MLAELPLVRAVRDHDERGMWRIEYAADAELSEEMGHVVADVLARVLPPGAAAGPATGRDEGG